jgi:glycosyltransferase involved in cell wall biosynthesis
MRTVFFTICAKNYLPIARACLSSLRDTHPDAHLALVLCDGMDQGYDPKCESWAVISVDQLSVPTFNDMKVRYDVMELNTAVKPFAFTYFFKCGFDAVFYVDPDLFFLTPLEECFAAFSAGQDAVVTPHITSPIGDGKSPGDIDMLRVGVYNLGFLALRRAPSSEAFAGWWGEKLRTGSVANLSEGLFTDQKWCDLLPSFIPKTVILHHPGYNVAYWNLMHRNIVQVPEGWEANGQPLRFAHFSGASFVDAGVFSKHQNRYTRATMGPLGSLYDTYRDLVRSNGIGEIEYTYSFDTAPNGGKIPRQLRLIYRSHRPSPEEGSVQALIDFALATANAPAPGLPDYGVHVSNVMMQIYRDRPDLQAAFNVRTPEGQVDFANWFITAAFAEAGLDDRFTGPVIASLAARGQLAATALSVQEVEAEAGDAAEARSQLNTGLVAKGSRFLLRHYPKLRPIYRGLPVRWRHAIRTRLERLESSSVAISPPGANWGHAQLKPGATLIGYSRAELGMGEHVRMTMAAMKSHGAPAAIFNVSDNVMARQEDHRFDNSLIENNPYAANIFHINADQLPHVTSRLGERFLQDRYNIVYPAWELAGWPDDWVPPLEQMDEIWAPSRFIQSAIAEKVKHPVIWMPLAVEIAEGYQNHTRASFGIPENALVFLFNFDLASFATRKNPEAVLSAFLSAFPAEGRPLASRRLPLLVIKALSAQHYPEALERLKLRVERDERILLITETLSAERVHGLVNCCDAFVSLHRSEGFGRGPAEAMRLGKPVIVTAYSGNLDFTLPNNSLLVPHKLVPLQDGDYPYAKGQFWADPSIEAAATHMRRIADDPDFGHAIGRVAAQFMAQQHSKSAIGARVISRLKEVGAI